jgi:hypothetical protein
MKSIIPLLIITVVASLAGSFAIADYTASKANKRVERLETVLQLIRHPEWTIYSEKAVGENEYADPEELVYVDLSRRLKLDGITNPNGLKVRFSLRSGLNVREAKGDAMDMLYAEIKK